MIHPNTELKFINGELGHGVVATKFIPAGTITWALDKLDREFSELDFQNMEPIYQTTVCEYTFRNKKGNFVLCWDIGRYVNHSFKPNCMATAYNFEIAIRDIQPGEQITNDYGYLNIIAPFRATDEGTKRKTVRPDDLLKYHKIWDNRIKQVFHKIVKVEQALKPILPEETWATVERIIAGKEQIRSILSNYYDRTLNEKPEQIHQAI